MNLTTLLHGTRKAFFQIYKYKGLDLRIQLINNGELCGLHQAYTRPPDRITLGAVLNTNQKSFVLGAKT